MLLIRIIEKLLIIYFALYLLIDIWLYLSAFLLFFTRKRRRDPVSDPYSSGDRPVCIIVPAYNEEVSVVQCTRMLLNLNHDNYRVIVVNDGSGDDTLERMLKGFQMDPSNVPLAEDLPLHTSAIRGFYTGEGGKLLLIDKENGGKADAINAGINFSDSDFVCTIDADSILDREALRRVTAPMVRNEAVFVSGGQIALSNDLTLEDNQVVSARLPRNIWVHWQILEYISTFMIARLTLSRINALLIMSGAFSVFRRRDLLEVGGFLSRINRHPYILKTIGAGKHTITEDMEIVLRLWKYYHDRRRRAKVVFLPGPVCWTEAPERGRQLFTQRSRWHQGLAESLWMYRSMLFEPRYKITGMVALPYYLLMELVAPVVKLFAMAFIAILVITGEINQQWIILMLAAVILITTLIMSSITVMIEHWSMYRSAVNRDALRYKTFADWVILLGSGVLGNFSYSFYRMFAQMQGLINYLRKRQEWEKIDRRGVLETHKTQTTESI
jgi:poly-beta-1,6-N-acetyl-D-glucosamine synthase